MEVKVEDTKARSRGWCFTIFMKDDDNPEEIRDRTIEAYPKAQYIIVGIEKCPSTGRTHLQGYVYFKDAVSFKSVKTVMRHSHWEKARGNAKQNREYCSKEGNSKERGEIPKQGKRNDLGEARELAKLGVSDLTILDKLGYQASRHAMLMKARGAGPKRDWMPEVYWKCGGTGTGKSKWCMDNYPDAWWSLKDLKNWEGYDGQEVVVFDDFRKDFCTFHELLRIFDRYPYRVNYKFGSGQLLAKIMIVTTPKCLFCTYATRCTEDINQLARRVAHQDGRCVSCGTRYTHVGGVILDPPTCSTDELLELLR